MYNIYNNNIIIFKKVIHSFKEKQGPVIKIHIGILNRRMQKKNTNVMISINTP